MYDLAALGTLYGLRGCRRGLGVTACVRDFSLAGGSAHRDNFATSRPAVTAAGCER